MYHKNAQVYKKNNLESEMLVANPHRVIQLMMQGVLERASQLKGFIQRRDYEQKSRKLSEILSLLNALQASLDFKYGEIPQSLNSLYDYMKERLLDASRDMDEVIVSEVIDLMLTIKSGWDMIPESEKDKAISMLNNKGE